MIGFRYWLAARNRAYNLSCSEAWAPHSSQGNLISKYLSSSKHSVEDVWHHFLSWQRSGEIVDSIGLDLNDLEDEHSYEDVERIDAYLDGRPDLWDEFHNYVMSRSPEDAPTLSYVDYRRKLPRDTWLVHFSDRASEISEHGFKLGEPNPAKLGLTRSRIPSMPGFNFAFVAGSRDSIAAARRGKYGSDAVMFMSPAQLVYHFGDEEHQAIFDGESVRAKDIVLVTRDNDGGWVVNSKRSGLRDPFRSDDFGKAQAWVMSNWEQYKRVIMS